MALPSGLTSYELKRSLVLSNDLEKYYHLRIDKDEKRLPVLTLDGQPAYTPIDFKQFFGKDGPIEIEIGCGKGGFMVDYAEKHPELPLLGIEKEAEIAFFAATRIAKRPHLPHARLLLGDAFFFLRDFLPKGCAQAVHMYFPDPWPKKRQRKHRLANAAFLELIRRVALPKAKFYWGTDHAEYHADSVELFSSLPWLKVLDANAEPTEGIQTNFEKKYRLAGKPIYRMVFEIETD